jgi:hypothetical protein
MARGGHGLPQVSHESVVPYPPGLMAVSGVASPQGGRPAAVVYPLDTPRRTPMVTRRTRSLEIEQCLVGEFRYQGDDVINY